MNVVFDAERLRNLNSGLGQFCASLGTSLVEAKPAGSDIAFIVPPDRVGMFGPDADYLPTKWWQRYMTPSGGDVWHAAHQDIWIRPAAAARLVLSIMDLNFLERNDYSAAKKARRLAAVQRRVDQADAIATISEFTASVVRRHLTIPDIPVRAIHLGNPMEAPGRRVEARRPPGALGELAPGSFFLFVGVIHPKKNVHTLAPVMRGFPEHRLVLAGPDGNPYAAEVRQAATAAGVADRVLMPGAVDESTKRWLYENCRALLFPSLSEGFGLPVVEAMSVGKPAFLSGLTSLPEIGGDVARYFDSFDPEAMIAIIRRELAEYDARPMAANELRAHAARFSWTRAATEYWAHYDEVHRSPRR
jgi:glycosyltransferase involved in cell wall biosynthesis